MSVDVTHNMTSCIKLKTKKNNYTSADDVGNYYMYEHALIN